MRGEPRGTLKGGFVIEDDIDRGGFEKWTQATFVEEGFQEDIALEFLKHLRGDTTPDVDAAESKHLKGKIARFRTINAGKSIERFHANGVLLGKTHLRGDGREIAFTNHIGEPLGLGDSGALPEKAVEISHAHAGKDAFPTDMTVFLAQEHEELIADATIGCVAGVTAFARKGAVRNAIPDEASLTETCASGDQCPIAHLL